MDTSCPEILLLHTVSQPEIRYGRLQKAAGRTAPVGLACLAAAFPGRTTMIDLQATLPGDRLADLPPADGIRAVVVQAASDWTEDTSAAFAQALAGRYPGARRVLGGAVRRRFARDWDVLLSGTGRTLLASLLDGGQPATGWRETLADDLREPLSVPEAPLPEAGSYSVSVEKQIAGRTVGIYQPWLGLLDRTTRLGVRAPGGFLDRLVPWLARSGFGSAAFAAPVFPADTFGRLQEICARNRFPFSLAVADPDEAAAIALLPTGFLDRLWLHPGGQFELLDAFARIAPRFGEAAVPIGLRLTGALAGDPDLDGLGPFCDQLSVEHPLDWDCFRLRRTLIEFYLRQGRLWRHLWRIRSARDLLGFMRGAYGIFDLLIRK